MAVDAARAKSLFLKAVELTDPAQRAAYLEDECAGDAELLQRVKALLAADDVSQVRLEGTFVNTLTTNENPSPAGPEGTFVSSDPSAGETTVAGEPNAHAPSEHSTVQGQPDSPDDVESTFAGDTTGRSHPRSGGAQIIAGRYTLLDVIGEGGMGTVYRAGQSQPVKRQVALKLIKIGMNSRDVLARFDAERQALALMDHPNIARIYDGGVTETGQPYFVMELVDGVPLTEYCDQKRLTVNDRLELFVSVCQAVQHAHQKGIIHRDLKPSNVLVTEVDGRPTPKVIDFGVAKATEQKLTDMSFADTGAIVGTPAYMSPEQAEPSSMDIDTRTDVYSLGVMLYELLVGSPPLDARDFQRGALLEMLRMVREVDPPRPSTKLGSSDTLPNIAANRNIEPAKLSKLLQGELDWVVMKALEKDRNRRYETANGMARDIQRYLADEVVEARPPSTGYRLRKFVRRHKGQVIAASLLLFTLLAGIAGTTFGLLRADQRRKEAETARAAETAQRRLAETNERKALAAAEQERTARQAEERERKFAEAIATFVKDDFLALTSVEGQDRFGGDDAGRLSKDTTLRDLLDRAAEKLKARKDLDPRIEAELCWIVGVNYRGAGDTAKGVPFLERAVELRKQVLGQDHPETLHSMNSLGVAFTDEGNLDQAIPLLEETLQRSRTVHGNDYPRTIACMGNLGRAYRDARQLDRAIPLLEESLALEKAKYGPDHPELLVTMNNLAGGYMLEGKLDRAIPLSEETLALSRAKLGPENPTTLSAMDGLAVALWMGKRLDRSIPLFEESLALSEKILGREHPETQKTVANLGVNYKDAGRLAEALPLLEEAYRSSERVMALRWVGSQLLEVYENAGKRAEALELSEKVLAEARKSLPMDSVPLGNTLSVFALLHLKFEDFTGAEPLIREALVIRAKTMPDAWNTFNSRVMLGWSLLGQKKFAEAEPLLLAGYEGMKTRENTIPPEIRNRLPEAIDHLIELYTATGKPDEVKKWQAERAKYPAAEPAPPAGK